MSSNLLRAALAVARNTRRLAQLGANDGTGARYPRDYYRPLDRANARWLGQEV
jgi:CHASE1-domain containing sensor protein